MSKFGELNQYSNEKISKFWYSNVDLLEFAVLEELNIERESGERKWYSNRL